MRWSRGLGIGLLVAAAGCVPSTGPIALDDSASSRGETVTIAVLANDRGSGGSAMTIESIDTGQTAGIVRDNGDGTVSYEPPEGFSGEDSFVYVARDETGRTASATVTALVERPGPLALLLEPPTESIAFGGVLAGVPQLTEVVVVALGEGETLVAPRVEGGPAGLSIVEPLEGSEHPSCSGTIRAGERCSIRLRWVPERLGDLSAQLIVENEEGETLRSAVVGSADGYAIRLTPDPVDLLLHAPLRRGASLDEFGERYDASGRAVLENVHAEPVEIIRFTLDDPSGLMTADTGECQTVLEAGESCALVISLSRPVQSLAEVLQPGLLTVQFGPSGVTNEVEVRAGVPTPVPVSPLSTTLLSESNLLRGIPAGYTGVPGLHGFKVEARLCDEAVRDAGCPHAFSQELEGRETTIVFDTLTPVLARRAQSPERTYLETGWVLEWSVAVDSGTPPEQSSPSVRNRIGCVVDVDETTRLCNFVFPREGQTAGQDASILFTYDTKDRVQVEVVPFFNGQPVESGDSEAVDLATGEGKGVMSFTLSDVTNENQGRVDALHFLVREPGGDLRLEGVVSPLIFHFNPPTTTTTTTTTTMTTTTTTPVP